jgi:hypothetical protein
LGRVWDVGAQITLVKINVHKSTEKNPESMIWLSYTHIRQNFSVVLQCLQACFASSDNILVVEFETFLVWNNFLSLSLEAL